MECIVDSMRVSENGKQQDPGHISNFSSQEWYLPTSRDEILESRNSFFVSVYEPFISVFSSYSANKICSKPLF